MNAAQNLVSGADRMHGAAALARYGDQTALVGGDESVSYAELAARVARAGAALRARGVRPGERGLLLRRPTPEFPAAWLGTLRAGAVAVALNTKLSEAEYRPVLADSAPRLAIIEDLFVAARPDLAAELAGAGRLAVSGAAPGGLPSWSSRLGRAPPRRRGGGGGRGVCPPPQAGGVFQRAVVLPPAARAACAAPGAVPRRASLRRSR